MRKARADVRRAQKEMRWKFDLHEVPVFEKKRRGYDPGEVDNYLNSLIGAYVKIYDECCELKAVTGEYNLFKEKVLHILITKEIARLEADAAQAERLSAEPPPAAEPPPTVMIEPREITGYREEKAFDISVLVDKMLNGRTVTFDEIAA